VHVGVHLVGGTDDRTAHRAELSAAAGKAFEADARGLHATWTSTKGLARWRGEIEKSLGKAEGGELPDALRAHVDPLLSPTLSYHVGDASAGELVPME